MQMSLFNDDVEDQLPVVQPGERICPDCRHSKTLLSFYRNDKHNPGRVSTRCRECHDARNWEKAAIRRFGKDAAEWYHQTLNAQRGVCAICNCTAEQAATHRGKRLSIDHDHATGGLRGLLCNGCNVGIGHFGDSIELMHAAQCYLLKGRNVLAELAAQAVTKRDLYEPYVHKTWGAGSD